jgi:hypothetical protein
VTLAHLSQNPVTFITLITTNNNTWFRLGRSHVEILGCQPAQPRVVVVRLCSDESDAIFNDSFSFLFVLLSKNKLEKVVTFVTHRGDLIQRYEQQ